MTSTGKIVAYVTVGVLFAWIAGTALGFIALPFQSISKQAEVAHEIIDETMTTDNAIYNYEWFKQQFQDINVAKQNVEVTEQQIADFKTTYGNATAWDYSTKQLYSQLQTQRTGQIQYYNELVGDYNARASMANRAIFKDNLPSHVDEIMTVTSI